MNGVLNEFSELNGTAQTSKQALTCFRGTLECNFFHLHEGLAVEVELVEKVCCGDNKRNCFLSPWLFLPTAMHGLFLPSGRGRGMWPSLVFSFFSLSFLFVFLIFFPLSHYLLSRPFFCSLLPFYCICLNVVCLHFLYIDTQTIILAPLFFQRLFKSCRHIKSPYYSLLGVINPNLRSSV